MKFYWKKILNKAEDPGTEVAKLHDLPNVRSRVSDTSALIRLAVGKLVEKHGAQTEKLFWVESIRSVFQGQSDFLQTRARKMQ